MKIVRLEAENFKRLVAVNINPDGTVCQITGRNGQGKSSVLDAIQAAFGGAKLSPEQPIRNGAAGAKIVVDTDEIRVTRKWTAKGDSLVVESKEGLRFPSPQAMLDKLNSNLAFDPLAFSRMPAKQQAEMLRELTGLDTSALDEERSRVFVTRTGINGEVKRLRTQADAIVVPECPDDPADEIDLEEVASKKTAAVMQRAENSVKRQKFAVSQATLRRAIAEREMLRKTLEEAEEAAMQAERLAEALEKECEGLVDPDTTAIDAEIAAAKRHNLQVRAIRQQIDECAKYHDEKTRLTHRLNEQEQRAAELTKRLEEIDAEKAKMLAAAKMPVEGMTIQGDRVCINGVPFSQASSAEQIRVGLAMGAALNPKLRVVLIRDGSLLDDKSMALVGKWAEANDMQVIVERVANDGAVGIVIEDGQVAETVLA